ncbi:MAG: thiolase family protein [Mariniblastus sp.]|nr:thiolase family protein [Mariniblastus sp.]
MNPSNSSPVFVGGLRTPFGRAGKGAYTEIRPDDLLVELFTAQASRHERLWQYGPQDLVVGCAYPEGEQGYNLGRMVALGAGLDVPGMTVNRLCASSLEALAIAAARIHSAWGDCYLVAGIESMSRIPRRGANFSESETIKSALATAYTPNGITAENVASQFPELDRSRQEDLAARSHELTFQAYEDGRYANQIHPYLIERDEFVRYPVDREKMASLKPAFLDDGSVTAATSSPLTDGATSGWVTSASVARQTGFTKALEIVDVAIAHVAPDVMGLGPVPATRLLLQRNDLQADDIAAYEINEAFAIQVLASATALQLPIERINRWGGAMAIGHPLGASGLRLVMTLHDRLVAEHTTGDLGIATLCVGGGQGMSILFRLIDL